MRSWLWVPNLWKTSHKHQPVVQDLSDLRFTTSLMTRLAHKMNRILPSRLLLDLDKASIFIEDSIFKNITMFVCWLILSSVQQCYPKHVLSDHYHLLFVTSCPKRAKDRSQQLVVYHLFLFPFPLEYSTLFYHIKEKNRFQA